MSGTLRDEIERGLARLGNLVGRDFRLDDHGMIGFAFEDGPSCTIELAPDGALVCVYAEVTRLPPDIGRAGMIEAAFGHNLFSVEPAGAWLALDGAADMLLLCHTIPAGSFDGDSLPELLMAMSAEALRLPRLLSEPAEQVNMPVPTGDIFIRV